MKIRVNYQVVFNKYLSRVLVWSFLLIVFFIKFTSYKSTFQYNSVESVNAYVMPVIGEDNRFELASVASNNEKLISEVSSFIKTETTVKIEPKIELEDWMIETTPWTFESPTEEDVELASWMLATQPFLVIKESEEINLEDWMVDTIAWNETNNFPLISEHTETIKIQNWMIRENAWTNCNGFDGSDIKRENLLATNNQF